MVVVNWGLYRALFSNEVPKYSGKDKDDLEQKLLEEKGAYEQIAQEWESSLKNKGFDVKVELTCLESKEDFRT